MNEVRIKMRLLSISTTATISRRRRRVSNAFLCVFIG